MSTPSSSSSLPPPPAEPSGTRISRARYTRSITVVYIPVHDGFHFENEVSFSTLERTVLTPSLVVGRTFVKFQPQLEGIFHSCLRCRLQGPRAARMCTFVDGFAHCVACDASSLSCPTLPSLLEEGKGSRLIMKEELPSYIPTCIDFQSLRVTPSQSSSPAKKEQHRGIILDVVVRYVKLFGEQRARALRGAEYINNDVVKALRDIGYTGNITCSVSKNLHGPDEKRWLRPTAASCDPSKRKKKQQNGTTTLSAAVPARRVPAPTTVCLRCKELGEECTTLGGRVACVRCRVDRHKCERLPSTDPNNMIRVVSATTWSVPADNDSDDDAVTEVAVKPHVNVTKKRKTSPTAAPTPEAVVMPDDILADVLSMQPPAPKRQMRVVFTTAKKLEEEDDEHDGDYELPVSIRKRKVPRSVAAFASQSIPALPSLSSSSPSPLEEKIPVQPALPQQSLPPPPAVAIVLDLVSDSENECDNTPPPPPTTATVIVVEEEQALSIPETDDINSDNEEEQSSAFSIGRDYIEREALKNRSYSSATESPQEPLSPFLAMESSVTAPTTPMVDVNAFLSTRYPPGYGQQRMTSFYDDILLTRSDKAWRPLPIDYHEQEQMQEYLINSGALLEQQQQQEDPMEVDVDVQPSFLENTGIPLLPSPTFAPDYFGANITATPPLTPTSIPTGSLHYQHQSSLNNNYYYGNAIPQTPQGCGLVLLPPNEPMSPQELFSQCDRGVS